jgi:ribosomal protein L35
MSDNIFWNRIKSDGLLFSLKKELDFDCPLDTFEIIISWYGMIGLAKLLRGITPFVDKMGNYKREFAFENHKLTQKYYDKNKKKEVITTAFVSPDMIKNISQCLNEIYQKYRQEIDVERKQAKGINVSKGMKKAKKIKSEEEKPMITTPEIKEEPKPVEESHNTNTDGHSGKRPIERIAEGTPTQPYTGKVPKEVRDFAHSIFPHAVESSEAEKQRKTQEAIRQEMHEAIMNDDDIPY